MLERISCRNCDSPNCEGCNIYILETMLNSGKLDCLMDEHHTISTAPAINAVDLVWCRECVMMQLCKIAQILGEDGYCSYGERKDK